MAYTASETAACRIAKLRVGCTVAGWAPGVRTITRSVLFHWTTGLTELAADSCEFRGSSWSAAALQRVTCVERLAQRSISVITYFGIGTSPFSFFLNIRW